MTASFYIYFWFYRDRSGGKLGPNDAENTQDGTVSLFNMEHKGQGHNHSMGGVLLSTSYTLMH